MADIVEYVYPPKQCPQCWHYGFLIERNECHLCGYKGKEPPKPVEASPPLWLCGLDLGMVSDPTALCISQRTTTLDKAGREVHHYAVRHLQRWLGVDYPTIAEDLRPIFEKLPSKPVLIADNTGVGVAVLQILRRANLPIRLLVPVTITAGHHVTRGLHGSFNVPKKELISVAQSALQGKRLAVAAKLKEANTLKKELQNFKVKINLNATESFEAWREGDHDDLCFSACLSVWFGEKHQTFKITFLD